LSPTRVLAAQPRAATFLNPTGLKQDRRATVVLSGHALVQNLRRRHYELAVEEPASLRVAAFHELALAI
jgi:hypothetical protein